MEDHARAVVEFVLHGEQACRRVMMRVTPLGEVVAQQAVDVLIGAALPGRMGPDIPDSSDENDDIYLT
jgi:hypothetical protein